MTEKTNYKFAIAGAGFSGAVLARELVTLLNCSVTIFEERDHIGGNCHSSRDEETGVMVHRYGPHIFNTNYEEVWDYVHRFCKMGTYIHHVKAYTSKGIFTLPINLSTINEFFDKQFTPSEAQEFINIEVDKSIQNPTNFEEVALVSIGERLYETFVKHYSTKQWGCTPKELPAEVVKRLPVRFNYNNNYHKSKYVGIPTEGYSALIENILTHPNIEVKLNTRVNRIISEEFDHLFYCGPIDKFYEYCYGDLGYRTVYWNHFKTNGDYQGIAQMNYTEANPEFTRIVEHKHFTPWEQHEKTIYSVEYSKETDRSDIPYYPKRLSVDIEKLKQYRNHAEQEETKVSFLGRLATYRYMDMDKTIFEALQFAKAFVAGLKSGKKPVFPNQED